MWKAFFKDYLKSLRKWWWEIIIGPIGIGIGLYQQIINKVIKLPVWGWVLIGVSTIIVGQVLAYRSLWLKMRADAEKNWIKRYEMEHDGELPPLPNYLVELFGKYTNKISKEMIPITPSGQKWNSLLHSQRKEWREVVEWLGKDPEDYLDHMRQMLPKTPRGVNK